MDVAPARAADLPRASTPPPPASGPATDGRVVVVGAGPAGMATAIELAHQGVPSVVLEKRGPVGTRENLFAVMPPFQDRLASLDPSGTLGSLVEPTPKFQLVSPDGQVTNREYVPPQPTPDPTRSRGDMSAMVAALNPQPGASDTRAWGKIGIGDLENGLRELARTRFSDLIELRTDADVTDVRTVGDVAEAVVAGPDGSSDAVRGAFLVDATGRDLAGGARRTWPEQAHFIGGRFTEPSDGDTTLRRTIAPATEPDGIPLSTIQLPSSDRTIVWAQVPEAPRDIPEAERRALVESRAEGVGVTGGLAEGRGTIPVSVQLSTSDEPVVGRVLKVGDSLRAPYFPTSTGAATAIIHDAPRAADAITSALRGAAPVEDALAGYAASALAANEQLLEASRPALLRDVGVDPADAGPPVTDVRAPAGASPQAL